MASLLKNRRSPADDAYASPLGRRRFGLAPVLSVEEDRTMLKPVVAVFLGSGLGALLRWWLGSHLNSRFPAIPPGTMSANLIGGYLFALAIAFFAFYSAIAPEWRLFVVTGFCGGLTTFLIFSA